MANTCIQEYYLMFARQTRRCLDMFDGTEEFGLVLVKETFQYPCFRFGMTYVLRAYGYVIEQQ